ncbi:MAG: AI-2E family transporter [Ottowia sp.]|nr:AI-2E family transporter [Ottowia sp.]
MPSPASRASLRRRLDKRATAASHLLIAAMLLLIMWQGLLAGFLSLCLGFITTRWLGRQLARVFGGGNSITKVWAAVLVILLPIVLLAIAVPRIRSLILDAPAQYRELLGLLAQTVFELRDKLPPDIAAQLPEGVADIQREVASYLASKAGALATTGRIWITGLLFAFIGLIIGVLAAIRPPATRQRPLTRALHQRTSRFGSTFAQIVTAQFWIALFNTFLTGIFLLLVLPIFATGLPYTNALLVLTFVASMIPIVGNIIVNTVLTLVGLSVSWTVALACLAFLIIIHKMEYFINAKIIGTRTHMSAWELLAAMFVMEAIFGPAGLVAAPLFYAYAKSELQASGWV